MNAENLTALLERLRGKLTPRPSTFSLSALLRPSETQVNRLIGCMLDPQGAHGLGEGPLRAFLYRIGHPAHKACGPLSPQVSVEAPVLSRNQTNRRVDVRIDLRIGTPSRINIENKPWAGEQNEQLDEYAQDALNISDSWLVYLPDRTEANGGRAPRSLTDHMRKKLSGFCILPYDTEGDAEGLIHLLFERHYGGSSHVTHARADIAIFLRQTVLNEDEGLRMRIKTLLDAIKTSDDVRSAAQIVEAWPILRGNYLVDNFRLITEKMKVFDPTLQVLMRGPVVGGGNEGKPHSEWPRLIGVGEKPIGNLFTLFGFRHAHWPQGWFVGFEPSSPDWRYVWLGLKGPQDAEAANAPATYERGLSPNDARYIHEKLRSEFEVLPAGWLDKPSTRISLGWPAWNGLKCADEILCRPIMPEDAALLTEWLRRVIEATEATRDHWPDKAGAVPSS